MAQSSIFTAGTDATATAMNNLRADAISRKVAFQFDIVGGVGVADNQGGQFLVPLNCTITEIKRKCKVGSSEVKIKKNTSTTIESNVTVTTSLQTQTTGIDVTALSEGDLLELDVTSSTSCEDLLVTVVASFNI